MKLKIQYQDTGTIREFKNDSEVIQFGQSCFMENEAHDTPLLPILTTYGAIEYITEYCENIMITKITKFGGE